jgi:hypothetical protein
MPLTESNYSDCNVEEKMLDPFYSHFYKRNTKRLAALLVPVLLVSIALPSQARPKRSKLSAEATKQFQIQAYQATQIPAGSIGNFVVMMNNYAVGPMAGLDVQEGKQVSIPVAGRVGSVEVPAGATLVGRFNRLNESSGSLAFDTLIANGRVYKINAASAPVPGTLRQDFADLQNNRDDRDFLKTGIKERREAARGDAARSYSNAAGGLVSNFSPLAGSLIGGIGSLISTSKEMEAIENSTTKQEEILDRDIPSVLVAEISPMQNITVQFNDAVDMNAPVATIPQPAQPQAVVPQPAQQGMPIAAPINSYAPPMTLTIPLSNVPPAYGYPGYGSYPGYGAPGAYPYPGGLRR